MLLQCLKTYLMAEARLLRKGKCTIDMETQASLTDGNVPSWLMCFGIKREDHSHVKAGTLKCNS